MNGVFDPLIQSVYERGGFVSGFAGDAFTAVFPDSALHALAAGWTIQQHMQANTDYDTPYDRFSVSAKVGAAAGEVAWGIVTSKDGQRAAYYFQGTAIDGCATAEQAAEMMLGLLPPIPSYSSWPNRWAWWSRSSICRRRFPAGDWRLWSRVDQPTAWATGASS